MEKIKKMFWKTSEKVQKIFSYINLKYFLNLALTGTNPGEQIRDV